MNMIKRLMPFIISAVCLAALLNFTWLKWGDIEVDLGREMHVPCELVSGRVLYTDIAYIYGPFAPYLNALLYKLFGVHIISLILSGILAVSLVSMLIYRINRVFLNRIFSTFTVIVFLTVFAFGHYVYYGTYNFILPYTYSAVYGVLFCLGALYFLYSWLRGRKKSIYICSALIFLALITRIEIGIALILSFAICGAVLKWCGDRIVRGYFLHCVILPLILAGLVYGMFFYNAWDKVLGSNLSGILNSNININMPFTARLSGTADLEGNILVILKVFFYYTAILGILAIGAYAVSLTAKRYAGIKGYLVSLPIGLVFISVIFILFNRVFGYNLQYRVLPLITAGVFIISLIKFIRKRDIKQYFLAVLALFSLLALLRMLFNCWAGHYGFYILVPGIIVYYIFFFHTSAEICARTGKYGKMFFETGLMVIFTLFVISHLAISGFCYKNKALKIESKRGGLYTFNNDREQRIKELIDYLKDHTKTADTLVIVPEGAGINFLSERKNPLYSYSYLPIDLLSSKDAEKNTIAELEENKVDYIAFLKRDTTEYGYPVFGKDYAVDMFSYISLRYDVEKVFGSFPFTAPQYGIALFKRKQ